MEVDSRAPPHQAQEQEQAMPEIRVHCAATVDVVMEYNAWRKIGDTNSEIEDAYYDYYR